MLQFSVLFMTGSPNRKPCSTVYAVLNMSISILERSELEIIAELDTPCPQEQNYLVENNLNHNIIVARAVVQPAGHQTVLRLLNPNNESIRLYKGMKLAKLEPLPNSSVVSTVTTDNKSSPTPPATSKHKQLLWQIAKNATALNEEHQNQLYQFFLQYTDVVALSDDDLGQTDYVRHTIETGSAHPIRQPPRRVPVHKRQQVTNLVNDMLNKNIIEPFASPWSSPVVLVKKKDGSLSFCIDYRKVNNVTKKDAYPLPLITDTLDTLARSKWFTTLDLLSGYWQVQLDDAAKEKTAFATKDCLSQFRVMPFGQCNGPATFQRLMDLVLLGLQWSICLVYLDDVIVLGRTFNDHMSNLREVFECLRAAKLKIKLAKCAFFQKKVTYLGHVVSDLVSQLTLPKRQLSPLGQLQPIASNFRHSWD